MKGKHWLNILKSSLHWILLICISNTFFIFLAWLAYPETFRILVHIMIIFSVVSIILGMLLVHKRQARRDKAFYEFIREPSPEHEDRLIESLGELHKEKVNYLANRLRILNDGLDDARLQSMDYKEFIESWVHEIKTPISLITLVLANRKEEMSPLVYQRLEHARIDISDDVEQILFYARLQASHVDYRLERVELKQCCEDVLLELRALLDEKEVAVVSDMGDIKIVSDEKALQFILTQIFVNSAKYSKREMESFIRIKTWFDTVQKRYYLQISDNGIGVRASDLPFIFDKGFTGDNPTGSSSTGIGLYLVKKLCDELQIGIEVESQYGEGFDIKLLFPVVEDNKAIVYI
jgi:signal transduction histidine kinase